jgi:hypothetical protein
LLDTALLSSLTESQVTSRAGSQACTCEGVKKDWNSIAPIELIRDRVASHVVCVEQRLVMRRTPVVDRYGASERAAVVHLCTAKP